MITIAELHRILERAMQKSQLGKDEEVKAAFASLGDLMRDYHAFAVPEFCSKAREGLSKAAKSKKAPKEAKPPKPAKAPAPKTAGTKTSTPSEPVIARYLGELEQTKADSRQFETVVERMKKDRQVRPVEAAEIANRFMGGEQSFKTKPEAAKAILHRQITDVRAAGKAEHIADIF